MFPEYEADARDAVDSYAVGLYPAAVFHAMLIAEMGLRATANSLDVELKCDGQIIHAAVSHLSKPRGESSKVLPTLIENCLRGCFCLHSQMRRVEMKRMSLLPQVGQVTPCGQRRAPKNSI